MNRPVLIVKQKIFAIIGSGGGKNGGPIILETELPHMTEEEAKKRVDELNLNQHRWGPFISVELPVHLEGGNICVIEENEKKVYG